MSVRSEPILDETEEAREREAMHNKVMTQHSHK